MRHEENGMVFQTETQLAEQLQVGTERANGMMVSDNINIREREHQHLDSAQ